MQIDPKLAAVIEKYRLHPQFLGMNIESVSDAGAMGDTMLHLAVEMGATEDIEILIASGAAVNAIGDIGNTPLHSAALIGKVPVAETLLELGADPSLKNEFGETAADVAKIGGYDKLAEILSNYQTRRAGRPAKTSTKPK